MKFTGPAKVFDSEELMVAALAQKNISKGNIKRGGRRIVNMVVVVCVYYLYDFWFLFFVCFVLCLGCTCIIICMFSLYVLFIFIASI